MGAVSFGTPKKLVLMIRDHFSIKTFIETGTYKGKTSMWASGMFDKVFTIENSKELFDSTSEKLEKYENIRFLFGNSAMQLKNVIDEIKQPAIFWLDAHWCGSNTYGSNDPCPLLAEIITIKQSILNHIILIDDARFFLIPPPEPQNPDLWPGLKEIMKLLNTDDIRYGRAIIEFCDFQIFSHPPLLPDLYNVVVFRKKFRPAKYFH